MLSFYGTCIIVYATAKCNNNQTVSADLLTCEPVKCVVKEKANRRGENCYMIPKLIANTFEKGILN